jgi:hypothetical protein
MSNPTKGDLAFIVHLAKQKVARAQDIAAQAQQRSLDAYGAVQDAEDELRAAEQKHAAA